MGNLWGNYSCLAVRKRRLEELPREFGHWYRSSWAASVDPAYTLSGREIGFDFTCGRLSFNNQG